MGMEIPSGATSTGSSGESDGSEGSHPDPSKPSYDPATGLRRLERLSLDPNDEVNIMNYVRALITDGGYNSWSAEEQRVVDYVASKWGEEQDEAAGERQVKLFLGGAELFANIPDMTPRPRTPRSQLRLEVRVIRDLIRDDIDAEEAAKERVAEKAGRSRSVSSEEVQRITSQKQEVEDLWPSDAESVVSQPSREGLTCGQDDRACMARQLPSRSKG